MATKYECDITGEQFDRQDKIQTVSITHMDGMVYASVDFGPNASLDDVRDELKYIIGEMKPFHDAWYNDETDEYEPPRSI